MTKYYAYDAGNGYRTVVDTLEEAIACANEVIADYRREALNDGEWDMSAEEIAVGIAGDDEDGENDIQTHAIKFEGDDDAGWDAILAPLKSTADAPEPSP